MLILEQERDRFPFPSFDRGHGALHARPGRRTRSTASHDAPDVPERVDRVIRPYQIPCSPAVSLSQAGCDLGTARQVQAVLAVLDQEEPVEEALRYRLLIS
jgi:hypothetical protein